MKTNKINLHWQSVLLGMALCMGLVFFVAGKANSQQNANQDGAVAVMSQTNLPARFPEMQIQILAINQNLARIEQKIDSLVVSMDHVLNIVRVMDREWEKNKKK